MQHWLLPHLDLYWLEFEFDEAPHHVAVLKNPQACSASRLQRLESSRIALLLLGPGLRRRPLAHGLVNAQRYKTNDAR
jgi:hypothetical protein